jgi:hypothetical protein
MMIRLVVLLALETIHASTISAAASQCASPTAIAATRTHWAAIRSQFNNAADHEAACRAYAASFYASVTARQAAAGCIRETDHADNGQEIAALDSEINAFNDLLATKCGG